MIRKRKPSRQTLDVLECLGAPRAEWLYGLEIAERTGLKSGSLYPILIRLAERGLLEAEWQDPAQEGRPPRHAYRILPAGRKALADAAKSPTKGNLREVQS